jgi:hypothetical protein
MPHPDDLLGTVLALATADFASDGSRHMIVFLQESRDFWIDRLG